MAECMKVNGEIIIKKGKDMKNFPILLYMMENIKKASLMATESMDGKMVKFIKVNGNKELKVGLEYGGVLKETLTSDNGKTGKRKDTGSTHGLTGTDMKDNISNV